MAFVSGCRPGATLSYDVHVSDAIPRTVAIDLRVEGLPPGREVALRSYASPTDSRILDVRVAGDDGRAISVRSSPGTGGRAALFAFNVPRSGRAWIRYGIELAGRPGDAHTGFEYRRKLVVDDRFAIVRGRDLFLFPDRPDLVSGTRVSYRLPDGWKAWSSWSPNGTHEDAIELRGRAEIERMLVSPIGLGDFQTHRFVLDGTDYRILAASAIPRPAAQDVVHQLEAAARGVASRLDRRLEPNYIAFVLPRSSEGDEITGDASGDGQGATLYPLTTERIRHFTRRLLEARLLFPSRSLSFRDPRDRWFPIGLREYLSLEVVAAVRGISQETVDRYLGHEYGMLPVDQPQALDLERAFADPNSSAAQLAAGAVAPLAVRALKDRIGDERWRQWLRQISGSETVGSIWDDMPLSAADQTRLRAEWVRGGGRLPMEFTEEVSEIESSPRDSSRTSAVAKSLRVGITAQGFGYLENCGCKVNQSGGLARRSALFKRLRREPMPALFIDVGSGLAEVTPGQSLDPFARAEQRAYLEIVSRLGYAGMAPGRTELGRGPHVFNALRSGLPLPYTAANVARLDGAPYLPAIQTAMVGGVRCRVIGIPSAMNPFYRPSALEEALDSLQFEDPAAAVARTTASLPFSDFVIVTGEIPYRVIRDIAKTCPRVDLIVACPQMYLGELAPQSRSRSRQRDWPGFLGNTLVAYANLGAYGVTAVTVDLAEDHRITDARFERYELDEHIVDDADVRASLDEFYRNVAPDAVATAHVKSPAALWAPVPEAGWVGAGTCAQCHEAETTQWTQTPHARAMTTLTHAHRDAQPRCVSCHVVGYGTPGGYRIGAGTAHLANVQCENCHGPGKQHAEDPSPRNIAKQVPEAVCVSCHDAEHSDAFDYADRVPAVRHGLSEARAAGR